MRLLLATLVFIAGTVPAAAQWLDRPWPGIPRTADGKPNLAAPAPRTPDGKPDLTGVWTAPNPSVRPDPANAQPWVTDLAHQRRQDYFKARPFYQCLPSGPEAPTFGGWKRFLQTPTTIAILMDDLRYRVIHMDGRELEAEPAPSWMGYSVGRWDGDTLVVDSNGFNDKTWLTGFGGLSHTEALRVRERYRRPDFGHMEVEVTYTDPGAYVKPWGFQASMTLAADTEMLEAVCERRESWTGTVADAAKTAVTVSPDVLARYVGVYSGLRLGRIQTVRISLSDGRLFADAEPLVAQSETLFVSGLGYKFDVDDKGVATHVTEIHISGGYRYARQP